MIQIKLKTFLFYELKHYHIINRVEDLEDEGRQTRLCDD